MKKVNSFLAGFTGFYESIWEYGDLEYDDAYNLASELNGTYDISDIADAIMENTDYEQRRHDIVETIANEYEFAGTDLGIIEKLEVEGLRSPKYYNFSTDAIDVLFYFTESNEKKFLELIDKHKPYLIEYVKNNYSGRDGFIPFHSNDFDDWIGEIFTDEHKFGVIFYQLCLLEGYGLKDYDIYEIAECYIGAYYTIEDVQNYLMPFKASEFICDKSGEPLNEYNYFDFQTIKKATEYEKLIGKKPKVHSFNSRIDDKFTWYDAELHEPFILDRDQAWVEIDEILHFVTN